MYELWDIINLRVDGRIFMVSENQQKSNSLEENKPKLKPKSGIMKGAFSLTALNYITFIGDILTTIYTSVVISNIQEIGIYNALLQYVPIVNLIVVFGLKNTANKFVGMYDTQGELKKSAGVTYSILLFNCTISLLSSCLFLFLPTVFLKIITIDTVYIKYAQLLGLTFLFTPILVLNHLLILRYEFKDYMIANLIGSVLRQVFLVYFLYNLQDISAFFYSTLIGNGFIFLYLLVRILFIYGKPSFRISYSEVIKFAIPIFLSQIFVYLKQYIYNLIFLLYFQDLAQMGLLYYIVKLFNLVLTLFNSLHSVLTVFYAPIIYKENRNEKYYQVSFEISKLFQLISFLFGMVFITISPFFIRFITEIYSYTGIYSIGTISMFLFGVFIVLNIFYYIPPTLVNLYKDSHRILKVHFFATIVYSGSYFIFIKLFGMPGIPIGQILGFITFLILNTREIRKELRIGFDVLSFKKILLSFIPFVVISPILFWIGLKDQKYIPMTLSDRVVHFPLGTLIFTIILISVALLGTIYTMRKLSVFTKTDENLFNSLFGKKFGKLLCLIFIKKGNDGFSD